MTRARAPRGWAHYDRGRSRHRSRPIPNRTMLDYLARLGRDASRRAGAALQGRDAHLGRARALSDAFAAALAALGVKRGDRVALLLPNCPQFLIAEFGAWKIGAIVAPLNPIYTEHELEAPLREQRHRDDRHADALLRARQARAAAHAGAPRHRHQHQGVLSAAAAAAVHAGAREARTAIASTLAPGDHDFADLLRAHARTHAGARRR